MAVLNVISYEVKGFPGRFAITLDTDSQLFTSKYQSGGRGAEHWRVDVEPSSDYAQFLLNIHAAAASQHTEQAYTGRYLAYAFSTTLHEKSTDQYDRKAALMEGVSGVGLALGWAVLDEYNYSERTATGTTIYKRYRVVEEGLGCPSRKTTPGELTYEGEPVIALDYVFGFYTKGITLVPYSDTLRDFFRTTEQRLLQLTQAIYQNLRQDQPELVDTLTHLALHSTGLLGLPKPSDEQQSQ